MKPYTMALLQQSALTIQNAPNFGPINPPVRLLCGPGPGNADPRVHAAMSLPQIGHMDPAQASISGRSLTMLSSK